MSVIDLKIYISRLIPIFDRAFNDVWPRHGWAAQFLLHVREINAQWRYFYEKKMCINILDEVFVQGNAGHYDVKRPTFITNVILRNLSVQRNFVDDSYDEFS